MMFGAQSDAEDYHKVGFEADTLAHFLSEADFCAIERVGNFNLGFSDTSEMTYAGYEISLNIAARPCSYKDHSSEQMISHSASPYTGFQRHHSPKEKVV